MSGARLWLACAVAGAICATPVMADWTGEPVNDGHGHSFFLATSTIDPVTVDLFCGEDGVVNLSLSWPDTAHPDAAETGEPALVTISAAGTDYAAKSYYWASGKGRLVLDFGNPQAVPDIVRAMAAGNSLAIAIDDAAKGIAMTLDPGVEGAAEIAASFLAWCPAGSPSPAAN